MSLTNNIPLLGQALQSQQNRFDTYVNNGVNMLYNRKMWDLQNEYNTPKNQVDRLRQAGLNPQLMYGKTANTGNSAATPNITTGAPRTEGIVNSLLASQDLEIKNEQAELIRAQKLAKLEEASWIAEKRKDTIFGWKTKEFNLGLEQEVRDYSIDARKETVRQLRIENVYKFEENIRKNIMLGYNIENVVSKTLLNAELKAKTQEEKRNLIEIRKGIIKENVVKQFRARLAEQNINPNDPIYARLLAQWLENTIAEPSKTGFGAGIKQGFKRWLPKRNN